MAEWRPSDADRRIIQQLINRERRRPHPHPAGREGVIEHEEWLAPEVHVARVPHAGIPPLDEHETGTGTGTHTEDDEPGSAICEIWRIVPEPDYTGTGTSNEDLIGWTWRLSRIPGFQHRVFNIGTAWIEGDQWALVARDKPGSWIVTTTGRQVVQPCGGGSFFVYQPRCDGNALNRYKQLVQISFDHLGCLDVNVGEWTFDAQLSACACECVDTGTGTGTEGEGGSPCECPAGPLSVTATGGCTCTNGITASLATGVAGPCVGYACCYTGNGPSTADCRASMAFTLRCQNGQWTLNMANISINAVSTGIVSFSQSPFQIVFDMVVTSVSGALPPGMCSVGATFQATVTE